MRVLTRRAVTGALAALPMLMSAAEAQEKKSVRILMDWIIAAQHTPFLIADQKGYFKEQGITVKIDPGKGSGFAAINTANGVYDFGWGDLTTMIKFNVENPGSALVIVYQSVDDTPLAVVTTKDRNINSPADLNGRKIQGTPGGVGFDTIGLLLKGANANDVKIDWVTVAGEMIPSMIVRGAMDGTTGHTFSQAPVLLDAGVAPENVKILKYSDYNVDIYGPAMFTTKAFAAANPETVRRVVAAVNKGTIEMLRSSEAALSALKAYDPMMVEKTERYRLDIVRGHMLTPRVEKNGLSSVDDARMQHSIDLMMDVFGRPRTTKVSDIYTDRFLPPAQERMVTQR
jgi:NitT/TauT family transport system substrate-binding protein